MEAFRFETDINLTNSEKELLNRIAGSFKQNDDNNEPKQCLLCKKEVTSYKKSHSIPQSIINQIAYGGKISNISAVLNSDLGKRESGKAEAQVFRCICNDCENRFSTYENGNLWERINNGELVDRILLEIKIKNILHKIFIRKEELRLLDEMEKQFNSNKVVIQAVQKEKEIKRIDFVDWNNELNKYRNYILNNKDCKGLFRILYLKKMDYVVPIALQEDEYYMHDTLWNVINDVYDYKRSHKIKALSVCIFPQKCHSIILMFVEDGCRTYKRLLEQLNNIPLEDQLKWITFLTLTYTQGYCLSKKIDISKMEGIKRLASIDDHIQAGIYRKVRKIDVQIKERKQLFEQGFENILSIEYRIDKGE